MQSPCPLSGLERESLLCNWGSARNALALGRCATGHAVTAPPSGSPLPWHPLRALVLTHLLFPGLRDHNLLRKRSRAVCICVFVYVHVCVRVCVCLWNPSLLCPLLHEVKLMPPAQLQCTESKRIEGD